MKNRIPILFLVLSLIMLCSCSNGDSKKEESISYDAHYSTQAQDRKYNEEILKNILRCFDDKNVEELKNMFSNYTQSNNDIEEQIENAYLMYEGNSVSYDGFWDYGSVYDYKKDGVYIIKKVGAQMENILTTEDKQYIISFHKFIVYDEDKTKLGVTQVVLRDAEGTVIAGIGE